MSLIVTFIEENWKERPQQTAETPPQTPQQMQPPIEQMVKRKRKAKIRLVLPQKNKVFIPDAESAAFADGDNTTKYVRNTPETALKAIKASQRGPKYSKQKYKAAQNILKKI